MRRKYLWSILCSFSVCIIALVALICVIALATAQDHKKESAFIKSSQGCVPLTYNGRGSGNTTADLDTLILKDEAIDSSTSDRDDGNSYGSRADKNYDGLEWSQGNQVKVFLVPHSHNDAGWLKTFEVYYKTITKNILDNMLEHMSNDEEMRFTWAEIAFFDLWWKDLESPKRALVKKLVAKKQLEFIGGGWVMPDEASTHYVSYLTQMIEGHQWLQERFNYTPNRGWTIDPFGLSPTYAYLQKRAGMESSTITRIHYSMKKYFAKEKILEFNWRQNWDLKGESDLFTHIMPSPTYDTADTCGPDHDFCVQFSREIAGEEVVSTSETAKIQQRSLSLVDQVRQKSRNFVTKNVLVPIGGDFKWDTYTSWNQGLKYLRSVVDYINAREHFKTELRITTLDDYFNAVAEDLKNSQLTPKSLAGDFFTYADRNDDYWSGYFTSRIYHKVTERQLLAKLRAAQLTFALMTAEVYRKRVTLSFKFIPALLEQLVESRRTLSLFQHHDGITGTSKDHVVLDYARKMDAALKKSMFVTQQSLFVLSNLESFGENQLEIISKHDVFFEPGSYKQSYRDLWTQKLLYLDEIRPEQTVTVFNSLAESRMEVVHVNVSSPNVKVFDSNGNEVVSEILPMINYVKATRYHQPRVEIQSNQFDLVFWAQMEPLEIKSFKIQYSQNRANDQVKVKVMNSEAVFDGNLLDHFEISSGINSKGKEFTIQNQNFNLQFNENGTLNTVIQHGEEIPLNLTFFKYSTYSSGVYLFIPNSEATPIVLSQPVIVIVEGQLESYLRAYYDTVHQKITLQNIQGIESNAIQVELLIDVREKYNYELIMRLETDIKSEDKFYTDSNGFQMLKRRYFYNVPVQGNYYPVASSAYIEDPNLRMTLLAGQPGGASSLASGQIEIMIDRIVNQDDYRGVGQDGTDNLRVISKFKILLETPSCEPTDALKNINVRESLSLEAHHQLHALLYPLNIFVQPESQNSEVGSSGEMPSYRIENNRNIPCDIHLAGLFPLPKDEDMSSVPEARHETSLLFHRVGFDRRFDSSQLGNTCDLRYSKAGRLKVQDILGPLIMSRMERTSLNLVHEEEIAYSEDEFVMKPMEMYAFRTHFNSDRV
ncbi:unnamed protein product [Allacma fusca]|uniref:mannosyl-oligosaccharide 1,3-1,6-alpha-mannosidase n=1 Tax=Allacma fusca TaxID=39272 RepID=A0A8J2JJZ3_9HEXA|nr:unnamed protein product [Allacma fusca]